MANRPKILLLFENPATGPVVDEATVVRLGRLGKVIRPPGRAKDWSDAQLVGWLADADAVVTSWGSPKLTADRLAAAPRLRFIGHAAGTVVPYVDAAAWQRGIVVVSGNAAMAEQVAEWAVALAIMSLRRWKEMSARLAAGGWGGGELAAAREPLAGLPVGVVGFGQVARHAIRLFAAFGCRVTVTAPEPAEAIAAVGAVKVDLDRLLLDCRVVSLHAPHNPQTERMIGPAQLARLPDGAVLVNTARGQLVDTAALSAECTTGRLRAALDVTDPEPLPPNHPLWKMDNVILSPHCAGPTPGRRRDFGRLVADDLEAFLAGRPLANVVTPDRARIMSRR